MKIGIQLPYWRCVSSDFISVEPGFVCGIVQDGVGFRGGEPVIKLHMEAYLGAPDSYDSVRITGNPPLAMKITGGVHGDVATASIVVNSLPKVIQAPPGLNESREIT
jgi:2,4-diaminopentanoate dehydrogenase